MKRYINDFPTKLTGIEFKTLENSKYSIYGLSEELNLIYVNPAWVNFAQENGGNDTLLENLPLGAPITQTFYGEIIKNFYTENYMKVLDTGKPWRHEYECSSINEFRQFHQETYPLKNGTGLIIINTITINLPMKDKRRNTLKAIDNRYVNDTGFITQCSNCRCTQRVKEPEVWDWVPEWLKNMPENSSHSICPICFDYYWKV
jgi:hypothetical protein